MLCHTPDLFLSSLRQINEIKTTHYFNNFVIFAPYYYRKFFNNKSAEQNRNEYQKSI